jgi:NAD(P)-dependent dehydrogenase (short-subunit alcohol dehydrogenase family)
MRRDLEGANVLITGASSGVGLAAAESFARAGCDVALLARGHSGLEAAAQRVRACGRTAVVTPADVTDREAVRRAVREACEALGSLDVVVVNAAATVFGPFQEVDPEAFDRVVEVTFLGTVNVTREVLGELERTAGVLVATGSLMTKVPLPTFSSYAAAKHAQRGFLNTLRVELRARRSPVEVALLNPGAIDTPIWDHTASATGRLPRRPPEGYRPEDVAGALVALARDPRPEVTFGGEPRLIELLYSHVRPAGELLLAAVHHYNLSGRRAASSGQQVLREGVGRGARGDGMIARPSLTASLGTVLAPLRALRRAA